MVSGTVKWWDGNKGVGALVSPDAPDDVWFHISVIEAFDIESKLRKGDPVEFEYVAVPQDSFSLVAERVVLK